MKVFIAHSVRDRELVIGMVTLLRKESHDVLVSLEMTATKDLLSEISAAIRSADIFIAIITIGNQNLFYELGLATGANVPTLIASPAGEMLSVDLASVPYVQLTGDPLRDAQLIVRRVKDYEGMSRKRATRFTSAEVTLQAATYDPAILEAIGPAEFERLLAELFKERGYKVVTSDETRETGVDLIITSPGNNETILVQIKKLSRQSQVSVQAVRELVGAVSLMDVPLGMLITTSTFTTSALALAAGTPVVLRTSRGSSCHKIRGRTVGT